MWGSLENWATNQKLLLVVCRSVTAFSQFFLTPSLRITLNRVWIEYAVIFIVMIFSSRDYDDIRLQAISHKSQVFFGTMASLKMVWFEFWIVNLKFYMLVLYKKNVISSMHFLKVWKWQKQKRIARFALTILLKGTQVEINCPNECHTFLKSPWWEDSDECGIEIFHRAPLEKIFF